MSYKAVIEIESIAPLTQSRMHATEFLDGESHEEFDKRTWREKMSYDPETEHVFLQPMAFKQSIDTAAKRQEIPDPDNKKGRMTKFFTTDCICLEPVFLFNKEGKPWLKSDAQPRQISANSTGVRGEGKRVPRTLPEIRFWKGTLVLEVNDEKIKPDMVERVVKYSGNSIGVGQFRPEKGGTNGRYKIMSFEIQRETDIQPIRAVAGGRR